MSMEYSRPRHTGCGAHLRGPGLQSRDVRYPPSGRKAGGRRVGAADRAAARTLDRTGGARTFSPSVAPAVPGGADAHGGLVRSPATARRRAQVTALEDRGPAIGSADRASTG